MAQTPSNITVNHDLRKSTVSEGLTQAIVSVTHKKRFFSQVFKSVVLHLWKTCNYGNSKARIKMSKFLTEAIYLGIYHCLVNAQLLSTDQDLEGITQQ